MRLKIQNRSQRYDITWPSPRHGDKYTKYKMCLGIMMVIKWSGKTRVTSCKLRVYSLKARVESLKTRVKTQNYEFKSTS